MKNIKLNNEKTIVFIEQKEVSITTDEITLVSLTDNGSSVEALISINNETKFITLWQDKDYINIGQWTDIDVSERINELL